jgi:hypothetical protein
MSKRTTHRKRVVEHPTLEQWPPEVTTERHGCDGPSRTSSAPIRPRR